MWAKYSINEATLQYYEIISSHFFNKKKARFPPENRARNYVTTNVSPNKNHVEENDGDYCHHSDC